MRVLQPLVISVCLGLTIHGAYAQKGSIHLNIPPQSLTSALEALTRSPGRMRLGVARGYFFTNLDPTLKVVIAEALRRLRDQGVVLVEADIPDLATLNGRVSFLIGDFEAPRDLSLYLAEHGTGVSLSELISTIAILTFATHSRKPSISAV